MKLKVPPALTLLIFGISMYVLDRFLPVGEFDFFGRRAMTFAMFVMGFLILMIAIVQFLRSKTTVDPMHPEKTSQLVTSGIFNYSRNPMYLGMLMFLIGWGLYLGNAFNTIIAAGFVYFMNHFQILPEEQALREKYGKVYQLYCKAVRRWF